MTSVNDISRLLPLLDMAFKAEQLKMSKVVARMAGLNSQLASLERPDFFDPQTVAFRGGADVLWETWVNDKKALIQQELALAARDREALRVRMVAALSKLEAVKHLHRKAGQRAHRITDRRAAW